MDLFEQLNSSWSKQHRATDYEVRHDFEVNEFVGEEREMKGLVEGVKNVKFREKCALLCCKVWKRRAREEKKEFYRMKEEIGEEMDILKYLENMRLLTNMSKVLFSEVELKFL